MPWSPLIFITVLFGVICGNRLTDNHRLLRPWAAAPGHVQSSPRDASSSTTTSIGSSSLADDLQMAAQQGFRQRTPNDPEAAAPAPCRQVFGLEERFLNDFYGLKECPTKERRDSMLLGVLEPNSHDEVFDVPTMNDKTKRDFFPMVSHDVAVDADMLSDIMGLEAPSLSSSSLDGNEPTSSFPANYLSNYRGERTSVAEEEEEEEDVAKRAGSAPAIGCDCKIKNDLLDLGQQHFPRYLLNAVCQGDSLNDYPQKCWHGSHCKPLEYKVKVLTFRNVLDRTQNDPLLAWLPDDLRQLWKFKTVTVAAGCFCSY